jgi:hypothetical protein
MEFDEKAKRLVLSWISQEDLKDKRDEYCAFKFGELVKDFSSEIERKMKLNHHFVGKTRKIYWDEEKKKEYEDYQSKLCRISGFCESVWREMWDQYKKEEKIVTVFLEKFIEKYNFSRAWFCEEIYLRIIINEPSPLS